MKYDQRTITTYVREAIDRYPRGRMTDLELDYPDITRWQTDRWGSDLIELVTSDGTVFEIKITKPRRQYARQTT